MVVKKLFLLKRLDMIKKLSEKIVDKLMGLTGTSSQREVYVYGLECFLNEVLNDIVLLLAALMLQCPVEMAVWIASFLFIRLYLGGYHAKTPLRCFLLSTMIGLFSIVLNEVWIGHPLAAGIILLPFFVFTAVYAPVVHSNHPLGEEQRKRLHKKAVWHYMIAMAAVYVMELMGITVFAPICSGLVLSSGLAMLAKGKELLYNSRRFTAKQGYDKL